MTIILNVGEKLSVCFDETDGEFIIEFNDQGIRVDTDLPDDHGRSGNIYEEKFKKISIEDIKVD